jgi:MFS family permease
MSAARLLEPAFGNSQIVWAALIGLILLSLAVGAWLGGWLADRFPRRRELDLTLTAARAGGGACAAAPGEHTSAAAGRARAGRRLRRTC